jgi:tetratricopeptide (TPR) repeat protein
MRSTEPGLVHILRDFLAAHQLMQDLFARHREGRLRFEDLRDLVGDDERSVLFRLKERCHTAFRNSREASGLTLQREALFDLAVGSLFHEAMKLRENFYQREVYGPRVRMLRSRSGGEAPELFQEFDRLLQAVSARIEEGVHESETLLARTVEQLRLLLALHRGDGAVVRFLVENATLAEATFGTSIDALLGETHGDTAAAFVLAGTSYLESGYYAPAASAFERALERDAEPSGLAPLLAYARGMDAYSRRDYAASLGALSTWAGSPDAAAPARLRLARDAVSCIARLAEGDHGSRIAAEAAALLTRLGSRVVDANR